MDRRLIACSCHWCGGTPAVVTPRDLEVIRQTGSGVFDTVFHSLDADYPTPFATDVAKAAQKAVESVVEDHMCNPPPKAVIGTHMDGFCAVWPRTDDGFYEARAFAEKHCFGWPGRQVMQVIDAERGPHYRVALSWGADNRTVWAESPQWANWS